MLCGWGCGGGWFGICRGAVSARPVAQSEGGGKPEYVSRELEETNTKFFNCFIQSSLCKVILLLSTGL